ncbi:sugar ABC transporter permease [Thalassobacillus devorans]|uniref:Transport permease protein n=1 Tax=Thalassobacillus devorans TaxID=279813 RepID=A0ABQ1NV99_9BACI|nr:ABC transporter permease [Thalassobacillus devorans]NIK28532.1 lipopolysaccharide transport system permease protein/teichoic acid transport system permease protein [Thalassobacillus devorans]GGC85474.1 sugar ABC transporter permease [Thalassobacillus devorans]
MKTYLQEMLKRKDLLIYLVKSGLKAEHRNSYLGYFWWLLDPLLNVLVYYFLVVVILGRGGENYPLFLVIGLVAWRAISATINTSAKSITRYSSIINQVYLPKSLFPLSFTLTQLFNFAFGLVVVAAFLAIYGVMPGWQVVYLPLIVLVQTVFLLGVGMILGYMTVFVRDIDNLLSYVIRIFFYASPIIWEGGRLPPEYSWAVDFNPIAIIVESYRAVLMHQSNPAFTGLLVIFVLSVAAIIFMIRYYSNNEHKIIKAL